MAAFTITIVGETSEIMEHRKALMLAIAERIEEVIQTEYVNVIDAVIDIDWILHYDDSRPIENARHIQV